MNSHAQQIHELCRLFLDFLSHVKRLSPNTLKAYRKDLEDLTKVPSSWLSPQKSPFPLDKKNQKGDKKNREQILKTLIQINIDRHSQLKSSSRSRKLASVRSFIKWLADEDHITEDFRKLFKSPKVSYKVPSFLSVDEVFSILNTFKKSHIKPEHQALFFLLYGGGLRVSEACRLKNQDINWNLQIIKLTGKGSKQRWVSLPQVLFEYLKPINPDSLYFFGEKALSERKAYDIIKSIGKKAQLLKPLHPHVLRHSFATHMMTGGVNLRVLQELLGHKSLTATQKYTHLDLARLSKTLENYHPFKKIVS